MAEQNALPDTELQLKKRARRRLVGAVALALFAVIVLPLVMDHEPRPALQDIQVRIPSQDAPPLSGKGALTKPLPVVPAAPVAVVTEPKPEVKPESKPEAKVEAKPEPAPVVAPKVEIKPVPAPVAPAVAEKPAAKPASAVETKEANAPAETPGQWVVQLGAYKEPGNVKLMLSKLKELNIPAYTEKFDTPQGPRTRVRAGPFPTREAAEKAQKRVKIIGVDGPVAPR